jgi:hypothetical protein
MELSFPKREIIRVLILSSLKIIISYLMSGIKQNLNKTIQALKTLSDQSPGKTHVHIFL